MSHYQVSNVGINNAKCPYAIYQLYTKNGTPYCIEEQCDYDKDYHGDHSHIDKREYNTGVFDMIQLKKLTIEDPAYIQSMNTISKMDFNGIPLRIDKLKKDIKKMFDVLRESSSNMTKKRLRDIRSMNNSLQSMNERIDSLENIVSKKARKEPTQDEKKTSTDTPHTVVLPTKNAEEQPMSIEGTAKEEHVVTAINSSNTTVLSTMQSNEPVDATNSSTTMVKRPLSDKSNVSKHFMIPLATIYDEIVDTGEKIDYDITILLKFAKWENVIDKNNMIEADLSKSIEYKDMIWNRLQKNASFLSDDPLTSYNDILTWCKDEKEKLMDGGENRNIIGQQSKGYVTINNREKNRF